MKNKDEIILEKIINYIEEIKLFIKDYSKDEFSSDKKTINACVFDLSQIGELSGKISNELIEKYYNIEWRGLKALRNKIVHDYDGINLNMVWNFLSEDLDKLRKDIEIILMEISN